MFEEDELLPLSALQHLQFCARQCALIHIEQEWKENRFTAQGNVLHRRTHRPGRETLGKVRVVRSLPLRSLALGVTGIADVVEFHPAQRDSGNQPAEAVPGLSGRWRVHLVEYKRGCRKQDTCDEIQLCAQAICLEEMLQCEISEAALFYGQTRRRCSVSLNDGLRRQTRDVASKLHDLIRSGKTPAAHYSTKCDSCSLIGLCVPKGTTTRQAEAYIQHALGQMIQSSKTVASDEATR